VFMVALMITFYPTVAMAHRVYVYAWVEGNKVFTESYFSSGERVRDGQILVFGPDEKKLLEGKTNKKGEFSFQIPQKTDLRIVLNAAMGHKGEYVLKAKDMGLNPGVDTTQEKEKLKIEKAAKAKSQNVMGGISEEKIKAIVGEVIDERLKPIARSIALLREEKGPGVTEIIGGIGYIIGLVGIALYFKSRK